MNLYFKEWIKWKKKKETGKKNEMYNEYNAKDGQSQLYLVFK